MSEYRLPRLPSGFKLVEYIESSGAQWINTGVNGNARWIVDVQANTTKGASQVVLTSTPGASAGTWFGEFTTTRHWDIVSGGTTIAPTTRVVADLYFESSGPHGTIGGVSVTRSIAVNNGNWSMLGDTTGLGPASVKMWSAKCYQNNTLVRNFVPCLKESNNEYGMFDLVTQTFYGNSGTGSFTGGAVIKQVEYISNGPNAQTMNRCRIDTGLTWATVKRVIGKITFDADKGTANIFAVGIISSSSTPVSYSAVSKPNTNPSPYNGAVVNVENSSFNSDGTFDYAINTGSHNTHNVNIAGWSDNTWTSNMNYYSMQFYGENSVWLRDFIPIQVGTEYAMLDLITYTVYRNAGSGAFTGGPEVPSTEKKNFVVAKSVSPIPPEYEEVEYIEMNTSNQYIDTLATPNGQYVDVTVVFKRITTGTAFLFGCRDKASSSSIHNLTEYITAQSLRGDFLNNGGSGVSGYTLVADQFNTVRMYNNGTGTNKVELNGVLFDGRGYFSSTDMGSFYIGGVHTGGETGPTPTHAVRTQFKEVILKWQGVDMHFVPVRNKTTLVYGMYDLVGKQFYGNSGDGGSFTGGNPVSIHTEIKKFVVAKAVPTKNLFDKDNRVRVTGYFASTGTTWYYASSAYSNKIPCKPNTTYTARYNGTSTQTVLGFGSCSTDEEPSANTPTVRVTKGVRQNSPTINTPLTITTGANDKWLIVAYNIAEPEHTDMANNLQVEEGSTPTQYVPHTIVKKFVIVKEV